MHSHATGGRGGLGSGQRWGQGGSWAKNGWKTHGDMAFRVLMDVDSTSADPATAARAAAASAAAAVGAETPAWASSIQSTRDVARGRAAAAAGGWGAVNDAMPSPCSCDVRRAIAVLQLWRPPVLRGPFQGIVLLLSIFAGIVHLCWNRPSFRMHVYFQSIFRIQNFQHSESSIFEYMCIFSQFSE